MTLLSVEGLSVSYGAIRAVRDVSFDVCEGEVVSLLGATGAGKTTTLEAIVGLLPAAGGSVRFAGESLLGDPPEEIVRRGLTLTPEGRNVFASLTVDDNLSLGAVARRGADVPARRREMFELFPLLERRRSQMAGTLSGGEQQQLAIARSLMSTPRLLMLDEPTLGLAPQMSAGIFALIASLRERGVTILLVEQDVHGALGIADRVFVLEHGEVADSGTPSAMLDSGAVGTGILGAVG